MKKLVALAALAAVVLGLAVPPADAHGGRGALALAAFAAFNVLFLPFAIAAAVTPPAVYAPPPAVYSSPAPVVYTRPAYVAAAPAPARQVVYPHGRYVLYGDGVSRAYQWIWVPNPPPPGSAPGY
jgi:hypothetical protein